MSAVVLSLPLLVAGGFGLAAPRLAARVPPRHATWLLSAGGAVAALSSLAVLAVLGSVLVGQQAEVAEKGRWSVAALQAHAPVDRGVGAMALVGAVAACAAALVLAVRRALAIHAAARRCRELPASAGELIVLPDTGVGAYAVPGRPGRIVVGRPLLAALAPAERAAVIAHERAHLEHGHHWHLVLVTLAGAVNPLLLPLRGAAEQAVERWADEDAAHAVGDRRVVAAALARAALHTGGRSGARPARAPAALAAVAHAVPLRVAALLAPAPTPRPRLLAPTVLLLAIGAGAAFAATKDVEHLFELARRAQAAGLSR